MMGEIVLISLNKSLQGLEKTPARGTQKNSYPFLRCQQQTSGKKGSHRGMSVNFFEVCASANFKKNLQIPLDSRFS